VRVDYWVHRLKPVLQGAEEFVSSLAASKSASSSREPRRSARSFDRLDENGLPNQPLRAPACARHAAPRRSSYATWRDIVPLKGVLSAALRSLRPPPRRSTRAPRFPPETRSRLRRRQRTIQTPPLPVAQALAGEPVVHTAPLKPVLPPAPIVFTSLTGSSFKYAALSVPFFFAIQSEWGRTAQRFVSTPCCAWHE